MYLNVSQAQSHMLAGDEPRRLAVCLDSLLHPDPPSKAKPWSLEMSQDPSHTLLVPLLPQPLL